MQRRRKPRSGPLSQEEIDAHYKRKIEIKKLEERLGIDLSPRNKPIDAEEEDDEDDETCVCKKRECEVVVACDYVCSSCSYPFCEDHHMKHCFDCGKRLCESCFREEDEDELDMCRKCTDEYHQSDHLDGLEHATIGHRQGGLDPYKNDE